MAVSSAVSLLEEFEDFFTELPPAVSSDLWFMMVMLSDENLVFGDPAEACEDEARELFRARTRVGRIGDMIYAASIFDIYFAMDAGKRFGADNAPPNSLYRYADQAAAIETAGRLWRQLRATKFAPAEIAAALAPPGLARDLQGDAVSVAGAG
jgi:hypothetical protein